MSSVWNFVKRNRGKLAIGGAVAGGVYVTHQYVQNHRDEIDAWIRSSNLMQASNSGSIIESSLHSQAQRHFIFDSNERSCDDALMQLIPSIKDRLITIINVESVANLLQQGKTMDNIGKVELWGQMKDDSLLRVIISVAGCCILVVSMKAQMSLLARNIANNHSNQSKLTWTGVLLDKVLNFTGISSPNCGQSKCVDSSSQQLFLQSLQYFTTLGIERFVKHTSPQVKKVLADLKLSDRLSKEKLATVVGKLRTCVDATDFTQFVLPLDSMLEADEGLNSMLQQLKSVLNSDYCVQLLDNLMDKMCSDFLKYCLDACPQLVTDSSSVHCSVAKLIPLWTNFLYKICDPDEIVGPIIVSAPVHEFAVRVFDTGVE